MNRDNSTSAPLSATADYPTLITTGSAVDWIEFRSSTLDVKTPSSNSRPAEVVPLRIQIAVGAVSLV